MTAPGRTVVASALAVALGALALAGCGGSGGGAGSSTGSSSSIDPDKVERLALAEAIKTGGAKYQPSVSCPGHIASRKGAVSYCRATFTIGGQPLVERVKVTASGSGGNVFVQLIPRAKGTFFENEVKQVAKARKIALQSVRCPAEVERVIGQTFTCTATVAGKPYTLTLRHTDDKGGITIVSSVPA